jgi:type IV fimbrial biogenesis protein FimT
MQKSGFTLIELLVTLAIVGIALGSAVPSFNAMIARNKLITQSNDVLVAINMARSEALKAGGTVSLQAVDGSDSANEFGAGFCIVVGTPGNCGTSIRTFPALDGATLDSLDDVTALQFNSMGGLKSMGSDSFRDLSLCNNNGNGRRIRITLIGRSKSYKPDPDETDNTVPTYPTC